MSILLVLSACGGWHPRGVGGRPLAFESAYVRGPNSEFQNATRTALANRGIAIVPNRSKADLIVEIINTNYDRRTLSIDPDSGKVREIELGIDVTYQVLGANGKVLVPEEQRSWRRDFVFDEVSLLGTVEQEQVTQRELAREAARSLVLRLSSLELSATQ
ncbi:MAG: LPS assembly lipoprotein LptE [Pseudomonadota bacterium]